MQDILIQGLEAVASGAAGEGARLSVRDIRIRAGRIAGLGQLAPQPGEQLVDGRGCVAYPAWVNTHHHLFQSLLKAEPQGLNRTLTPWLMASPYRFRQHYDEALFRTAVRIGLAELALSGCGTVADHCYLYHPGQTWDPSAVLFEEAQALGLRMVLCRGGATLARGGESALPSAMQPETIEAILRDLQRLAATYHDPAPDAMRRVVCAPSTPNHSLTPGQMRECAQEARRLGLRLHSHLSETVSYTDAVAEKHQMRPVEFAEHLGWCGPDVWFAHLVKLHPDEIAHLGATGTGIAHCPQSNGRLASGIAPVRELQAAGSPVSLGVDGAASNESADMVSEAHTAWLVARAREGEMARAVVEGGQGEDSVRMTSAEQVIHWGTQGGARVLGLGDVGRIEVGAVADIAVYDLSRDPRYFGVHDVFSAPVVCGGRAHVRRLFVQGREVVRDGQLAGLDLPGLAAEAREATRRLIARAGA